MSSQDLIIAASVVTFVTSSSCIAATVFGLGRHIWTLGRNGMDEFLHNTTQVTILLYVAYVAYAVATTLTKLSLVASYLRLFGASKNWRRFAYIVCFVVVALGISSVCVITMQCMPIQSGWNWTTQRHRCINILAFSVASSSINLATDVALLVAPMPTLWRTQTPLRNRVEICGLFGLGSL